MQISAISNQTISSQQTRQSSPAQSQESFSAALGAAMNSQATDSTSIWGQLNQQFDIHNATFDELKTVSFQLYQTGQIDLSHLGMLTLDLAPLERELGFSPDNQFLTPADQSGRRDWIAEWEARANQQLKWGNIKGYQGDQECLKILQRLE